MRVIRKSVWFLAMVVMAMPVVDQVSAVEVTFQDGIDGYAGTEDTWLKSGFGDVFNFGSRPNFSVGTFVNTGNGNRLPYRSLLRFDVTSLATDFPTGFTVNSATLRLAAATDITDTGTVNLHRLSDLNSGWVEGSSNNAEEEGASNWLRKNHVIGDLPAGTKWEGSLGASTPDVDFDSTVLASGAAVTVVNADFDLVMGGDLSFINTWANGGTNAGFLLKYADDNLGDLNVSFFSSDLTGGPGNIGRRPELILDVTANAAGPPGDFDGDTDVDGADFIKWQRDLGDATNLGLWEGNFGTGVGPIGAIQAVPEPSSLLLFGLAAVGFSLVSVSRSRFV